MAQNNSFSQQTNVDPKQAVTQPASTVMDTTGLGTENIPSGNMFDYATEINIPDDDLPF